MALYNSEATHRRALLLSEVSAEGASGLSRVLRQASTGDADAAALTVSSLVRSVRPLTALDTHEFLRRAHIRESDLAGEISPGQRVALVSLVDRYSHLHPPRF
jgi:hypothetical protein